MCSLNLAGWRHSPHSSGSVSPAQSSRMCCGAAQPVHDNRPVTPARSPHFVAWRSCLGTAVHLLQPKITLQLWPAEAWKHVELTISSCQNSNFRFHMPMKYTSDRRSPVTSSSAERAALVKCALADGCEKHGDCPKPEEWETNSGT